MSSFPHLVLTKPKDPSNPPTRADIDLLKEELIANAISVASNVGGGAHGHLFLLMTTEQYTTFTTVAAPGYVLPPPPGDAPEYPNGASNAVVAGMDRAQKAREDAYKLMKQVDALFKQQILATIHPDYMAAQKERLVGYANRSALQLLTHLETEYGAYTQAEISKNEKEFLKSWDPATERLEHYWHRIETCRNVATTAGDAISDQKTVRTIIENFDEAEIFPEKMLTWRDRPEDEWTYENVKAHFTKANKERLRKLTTRQMGYAREAITTTPGVAAAAETNTNQAWRKEADAELLRKHGLDYCWTHGVCKVGHNSQTCADRKEGHKEEATVFNTMGGRNTLHIPRPSRPGRGQGRGGRGRGREGNTEGRGGAGRT
jgi:hypothetical protein